MAKIKATKLKLKRVINDDTALYVCECGTEISLPIALVESKQATSCGCTTNQISKIKAPHPLQGKRFGKLVVIQYLGRRKWLCQCDCGNTYEAWSFLLNNKDSTKVPQSCGKCEKEAK